MIETTGYVIDLFDFLEWTSCAIFTADLHIAIDTIAGSKQRSRQ